MARYGRGRGGLVVVSTVLVAGALVVSCRGGRDAGDPPSPGASTVTSPSPTPTPSASASLAGAGASCGVVTMPGGDRFRLTVRKGKVACGQARKVYKTYLTKLRSGAAPGNGGGGAVHVRGWTCASGPATHPWSRCTKGGAAFAAKPATAAATTTPSGQVPGVSITLTPVRTGRKVKLRVRVVGYVYEPVGADDHKPIRFPDPAKPNILTDVELRWGDGGSWGANAGIVSCDKPHVLRRVDGAITLDTHTYRHPGTYPVKVTGYGCGLPKKGVTVRTNVTVH